MATPFVQKTKTSSKEFFKERLLVKYARHTPVVNIGELEDKYLLKLAAPGFRREELAVSVKDNKISISSLKPASAAGNELFRNSHCEYDFSVWKRSFVLPPDADAIMIYAAYINGELLVHIPKGGKGEIVDFLKIVVY
jgi:HSP20 family protein